MYNYHNYVYNYAVQYQKTAQPMPVLITPTTEDNIRLAAGIPSVSYYPETATVSDFTVYTSTNKAASFPAVIDDGRRDDAYAHLGLSA
jgi:hypothetical protein